MKRASRRGLGSRGKRSVSSSSVSSKNAAGSLVGHKVRLRVGDPVMVIAGGSKKYPIKGSKGKIRSILRDKNGNILVTVDGVNVRKRLFRARKPGDETRFIYTECPIHISNVMYYVEDMQKCVRLKYRVENGTKIRGYIHPEKKEFVRV